MANEANGQRDEVEMLAMMLLIRRFEERASQQYQAQKIGGFCHLYIGQEAVVAGAVAATRPDDYLITAYRDHAHALARGTSADACMAELFGKATGCSRGLGGSMHYFDKANHMYGGHAIVGAHVPLAAGMAFASKYRGEDRVTLCFFGDGAINQGSFHEALNLAGLFKLPVIFICENNFFAMGTSVKRSTSLEQIVDRARGYDMPSGIIDGMSFRDVRDGLRHLIASIRKDPRPAFVEVRTYRYRGHSMSDPASYRTKEELEKYRLEDPITRLRAQLQREGKLTNEEFDALDKKAKEAALQSVKFAEESPEPPVEKLYDYVFARGDEAAASTGKSDALEFAGKLRNWRLTKRYSRAQAARVLEVPYVTLESWEAGKREARKNSQGEILRKMESLVDEARYGLPEEGAVASPPAALEKAPPEEKGPPAVVKSAAKKAWPQKPATTFGARINDWRLTSGLTRKEAEKILQVPAETLKTWENGRYTPRAEKQRSVLRRMKSFLAAPQSQTKGNESNTPNEQKEPLGPERKKSGFATQLRDWRQRMDVGRSQAAKILQIPLETLKKWERGKYTPRPNRAQAMLRQMETQANEPRPRLDKEKPADKTTPNKTAAKPAAGSGSIEANFVQRLRDWRATHALGRERAAEILGISYKSLHGWENGLHQPSEKLEKVVVEKLETVDVPREETAEAALGRLKSWREKHGLNAAQAARLLDVPDATMHSWDTGKRKPFSKTRADMAKKMELPIEQLREQAEARGRKLQNDISPFIQQLNEWRKARGLDRMRAAEALAIPFSTYRSWENGKRRPRPEIQSAILSKLEALPGPGESAAPLPESLEPAPTEIAGGENSPSESAPVLGEGEDPSS